MEQYIDILLKIAKNKDDNTDITALKEIMNSILLSHTPKNIICQIKQYLLDNYRYTKSKRKLDKLEKIKKLFWFLQAEIPASNLGHQLTIKFLDQDRNEDKIEVSVWTTIGARMIERLQDGKNIDFKNKCQYGKSCRNKSCKKHVKFNYHNGGKRKSKKN